MLGACLLVLAGILFTVGASPDAAYADADDGFTEFGGHPSVVPDVPVQGYPRILDTPTYVVGNRTLRRQTQAIEMIGDYIVSGGDFMNVELQNGTIVSQPYLAVLTP